MISFTIGLLLYFASVQVPLLLTVWWSYPLRPSPFCASFGWFEDVSRYGQSKARGQEANGGLRRRSLLSFSHPGKRCGFDEQDSRPSFYRGKMGNLVAKLAFLPPPASYEKDWAELVFLSTERGQRIPACYIARPG